MQRTLKYLILLLPLHAVAQGTAQGIAQDTAQVATQDTLSLAQCRQLALQNSEDIKIAERQQQRTQAEKQAAFSHYLPKISASASLAYLFKDIDLSMDMSNVIPPAFQALMPSFVLPLDMSARGAYMAGIRLEQPLFAGGKIVAGNRMASLGMAMADENARMQRASTLAEVDKAYWVYVSVHEKIKILDKYDALLGRLDSSMQAGLSVDMMSEKDLLKVQSKRSSLAYDRLRAQHGLQLARMALCRLVGKDFGSAITPADSSIFAPDVTASAANDAPLSADISSRPEYRLMQHQVDINAQQVKMTRADFLPTIGLGAGYNHLGGMKLAGQSKSFDMPFAMVTANIPLFHFGEGMRKIKSARLQQDISAMELEKNAKLLSLQAQQAGLDWLDAQAQITVANDALRLANEDLRVSRAAYETSLGTLIEYLDAQAQWQQAYSNLIEARAACKIRETEYFRAVGTLE
ncbi:MAG: TolC family protein [Prevotellaceae bacterium]|jgi:outer membrane protein TolC|nr:TolC family protein [Prevotellaceae bacterium]